MLGDIAVKRAYEPDRPSDGYRVLIDRMWPRGIKKERLAIEEWNKGVAPSTRLRQWFGHDPGKWETFRQRYAAELDADKDAWQPLLEAARRGKLTLVYSAKDEQHNNAVLLQQFLLDKLAAEAGSGGPVRKAQGRGGPAKKGAAKKSGAVKKVKQRGKAARAQQQEE